MKKISIRNLIITLLCITVIFMAIGFIVMSQKFENIKKEEKTYDVVFTKIKEETSVKGGKNTPRCKNELQYQNHKINMNCTLYQPLDEVTYTAVIKNQGNLKAEIIDIIKSPDYLKENLKKSISPVVIKTTEVSGKILEPEEEINVKIVMAYQQTNNIKTIEFPYELTLITKSVN